MKIKNLLKTWYITHDPYSDLFQIYDSMIFNLDKSALIELKKKNMRLLIDKKSNEPVLFEINNYYDILKVDFDILSKSSIINLINPYIEELLRKNYGNK